MRCEIGFADEVIITAGSGAGGNGCVSFRKEKYIPKGGPDGGDGGNGGSVIAKATRRLHSLIDYSSLKYLKAHNGEPGKGKSQSGKNGDDLILEVPMGTIIQDADTGEILVDLIHDNQEVLLIPGGKGGKGNQHFATSTNRAPRIAQPGLPEQKKRLRLSLKYIADIGLLGLPNSGKSTLLSRLTMARPRIDSYPFTTITPNLGAMTFHDERSLIIADIPGLIEGASRGRGLGHRFLKHIERTSLLLQVLDISYKPEHGILADFYALKREIVAYNPDLARKPQMVLINKIDLHDSEHRDLAKLQNALEDVGVESLPISALTGEGLEELKKIIFEKWGNGTTATHRRFS